MNKDPNKDFTAEDDLETIQTIEEAASSEFRRLVEKLKEAAKKEEELK